MDKKKIVIYLAVTYMIAWTLQIIGSLYVLKHPGMTGTRVFQACLSICMFAPFAATLVSRKSLKGLGWKPMLKKNFKWIFFCILVTAFLTFIGSSMFFIFFPGLFDTSGPMMIAKYSEAGVDIMKEFEKAGISINKFYAVQLVTGIFLAPFINILTAIGEETGWRGFLYPELNKSFGKVRTWILGGIFWSVFHFPAMLIAGYEYGLDYIGSPWLGLITFTVFCIVLGILEEIVYDRTKCIWFPALLHGSINAVATLPQLFMNANDPDIAKYMVLGPLPNGLIAMIPIIIFAAAMAAWSIKRKKVNS